MPFTLFLLKHKTKNKFIHHNYSSNMENLPPEMITFVLEKIEDSLHLLHCREVCTRWTDIIDYLLIKLKRWEKICFNDHIRPWIHKVIEKRFSILPRNKWHVLTQLNWKQIFLSYRKWQICHQFEIYHRIIFSFNLPKHMAKNATITAMDIKANWLAIGSYTGRVCYFSIEEKIQPLYHEEYPNYCVTNIKFWYTDKTQLIAVISLDNRLLKFWNVQYKVSVPSSLIHYPSTTILSDGHRLFIANDSEIFECVWNGNIISKGKNCTFGRFSPNPTAQPLNIIIMNIDTDHKLTAVRCDYRVVLTNTFIIPTSENLDFQPIIEGYMRYYENDHFKQKQFIFSYPISNIFLIINDEHLHVCLKNSKKYQWKTLVLQPPLKSNISAFFMHANVVFFGLKSGSLLMYILEDVQHLLEFTTKPVYTRTFKLDNRPITILNIAEYNDILYIFATVGTKLYVVKFPTV